jgi:PBP1b-binding outer membrane lipoprotein LpoB
MKKLLLLCALLLSSCSSATKARLDEMVKAINEDRRSISILSESLLVVHRRQEMMDPGGLERLPAWEAKMKEKIEAAKEK